MANFTRNHYYTFDTIAPAYIGARYENLKLTDILSFERAVLIRQDIVSVTQNIKDNIPDSINMNAADLEWLTFKDMSNTEIVLAKQWLDLDTVVDLTELGGNKNVTIRLRATNLDRVAIINNALKDLGETDFDIDVE